MNNLEEIRKDFSRRATERANIDKSVLKEIRQKLRERKEEIVFETVEETKIPVKYIDEEFDEAVNAIGEIPELKANYDKLLNRKSDFYGHNYSTAPKGRVVIFTPSNTPLLSQLFLPLLSLYTGNVTAVKPSSSAFYASKALSKIVDDSAAEVNLRLIKMKGKELSDHLNIGWLDYIYYMGPRRGGIEVRKKFEGNFYGEYEGNNIGVVKEYDEEKISYVFDSLTYKNGIDCDNIRGVFVPEENKEEIADYIRERLSNLKEGDPFKPDTDLSEHLDVEKGVELEPEAEEIKDPDMNLKLWIKGFENAEELKDKLRSFFRQSRYGLSTLVTSEDQELVDYIEKVSSSTRICVNKSILEFEPTQPWGGRALTANGGAQNWIRKFTDTVSVEKFTESKGQEGKQV